MSCRKIAACVIVAGLVAAFGAGAAFAQGGPAGQPDDAARKAMAEQQEKLQEDQIRRELGVTSDDQWKVLYPRIRMAIAEPQFGFPEAQVRKQLGITSDDEWNLLYSKIKKTIAVRHDKLQAEQLRTELGVTSDDEWKVLYPKIRKVVLVSWQLSSPSRERNLPPSGDKAADDATSAIVKNLRAKTVALKEAMAKADAGPDDIAVNAAALREARKRAKTDLAKSCADLKELLTLRQEALVELHWAQLSDK